MANLFKIKEIARAKKISIKNLAETAGITEQGLQKLIRDNSTKVETLESIAYGLDVPISVFFDNPNNIGHKTTGHHSPISGNIEINNCKSELEKANLHIEYLEKTIKDKEEIINLLKSK
jgi:transcriptional regulator with XRE-family HTH domain